MRHERVMMKSTLNVESAMATPDGKDDYDKVSK